MQHPAMTNMSGDMTETQVTDFFTLPKFGRVSGSTNVWTWPCLKSGRVLTHGPRGNWCLWLDCSLGANQEVQCSLWRQSHIQI